MRRLALLASLTAGGVLLATSTSTFALAATGTPGHFGITLTPAKPDVSGVIPSIDVSVAISDVQAEAGETVVRLPSSLHTVVTSARDITALSASDDAGPLGIKAVDLPESNSIAYRTWVADRPVNGTLRFSYRVPVDATQPPIAKPQYELRTSDATISGSASSFLPLPDDATPRHVNVRWDLSALGDGALGVSSFGIGNVETKEAFKPEQMFSTYIMAGKPGLYKAEQGGFFGAWQGEPPFPATGLMQWAANLQEFYGRFFNYMPETFGVFMRPNPVNPGSGIGLTHSFAFTYNHTSEPGGLRGLLAHEMLHAWVRSFDNQDYEGGGLAASWFGEGLAVHYQRLLPYRAGLMSQAEFLEDLNQTAGRYYTNAMIGTPNADIPAGFWRDTRVRVLPYDRGSLYFAKVDADIRARSHGKRSLDDLVRTMLATRLRGEPMDQALWLRLLRAELGESGIRELDAMLAGGTVLPPSDAFGPCFRRVTKPLRRFDLGFDPASLLQAPKIVRGLKTNSEAAAAGLRDGDVILNTFSQDGLQANQTAYLTLNIRRGDEELTIRYQPRGETVDAYQWELNPASVGKAECRASVQQEAAR
ncbi:MAG TPA: peptidase M61 [Pedomonas sp.]|uniref:M61 family metallopeptidase n=1 Tax=Pedomonas sp. TaxID=2976421 RepID=UPI002F3F3CC4